MAERACWAASSGVLGRSVGESWGVPAFVWSFAVSVRWTADLSALDHTHTSLPLRMTSDSPEPPTRATRAWVGPPVTWPVRPARSGRPRFAVWTTVPDSCRVADCWTSTSSWAAVRGCRPESALAVRVATRVPAAMRTTAPAGRAQRAMGWSANGLTGPLSDVRPVTVLRASAVWCEAKRGRPGRGGDHAADRPRRVTPVLLAVGGVEPAREGRVGTGVLHHDVGRD